VLSKYIVKTNDINNKEIIQTWIGDYMNKGYSLLDATSKVKIVIVTATETYETAKNHDIKYSDWAETIRYFNDNY
jgi:hypothetical protein